MMTKANSKNMPMTLLLISLVFFVSFTGLAAKAYGQTDEVIPVIVGFIGSTDCELIEANGGSIRDCFEGIAAVAASVPVQAIPNDDRR